MMGQAGKRGRPAQEGKIFERGGKRMKPVSMEQRRKAQRLTVRDMKVEEEKEEGGWERKQLQRKRKKDASLLLLQGYFTRVGGGGKRKEGS